ncbi:MAG: LamG domain-containing protein, partial [Desulfobacterales bacterium]|nr:LamG domain-containing protein [Desulfobacterales bacterium]
GKGAFTFNGSTQYLNAGTHFPTSSSYTKTAWVKRTGTTGNNIISGGVNSGGHALWANNNSGKRLSAGHNGNWNIVQDNEDLPQDQWVFVALTYDNTTGQMILYRNGTPRNTGTAPVGDRNVTVSNIYIGSFGTEGFRWTGSIDDARVYAYVLSAEQIAAMYNSGTGNPMLLKNFLSAGFDSITQS